MFTYRSTKVNLDAHKPWMPCCQTSSPSQSDDAKAKEMGLMQTQVQDTSSTNLNHTFEIMLSSISFARKSLHPLSWFDSCEKGERADAVQKFKMSVASAYSFKFTTFNPSESSTDRIHALNAVTRWQNISWHSEATFYVAYPSIQRSKMARCDCHRKENPRPSLWVCVTQENFIELHAVIHPFNDNKSRVYHRVQWPWPDTRVLRRSGP
jgi:hypothetical protein